MSRFQTARNADATSLVRVVNDYSVQVVAGSPVPDARVRRYLYL